MIEFENELAALRPARPSPALQARIEAAIAAPTPVSARPFAAPAPAPASRRSPWFGWSLTALAAGAVLAGAIWWQRRPPASANPAPGVAVAPTPVSVAPKADPMARAAYRPVGAATVLYDLQDDGTVYLSGDSPVRRVTYRYVDTYTWKNPATNASLKWSVPREEIRVLPASFH